MLKFIRSLFVRKPIFVIGLPTGTPPSALVDINKILKGSPLNDDYHTLVFISTDDKEYFQSYCGKNIKKVEIEEIRRLINSKMKKSKVDGEV